MNSITESATRQHTPGPWHVENETDVEGLLRTWVISQAGVDVITFAFSPEHKDADPEQYAEASANACLIAAAPDMLAQLHDFANAVELFLASGRNDAQARNRIACASEYARATIAKATGK